MLCNSKKLQKEKKKKHLYCTKHQLARNQTEYATKIKNNAKE